MDATGAVRAVWIRNICKQTVKVGTIPNDAPPSTTFPAALHGKHNKKRPCVRLQGAPKKRRVVFVTSISNSRLDSTYTSPSSTVQDCPMVLKRALTRGSWRSFPWSSAVSLCFVHPLVVNAHTAISSRSSQLQDRLQSSASRPRTNPTSGRFSRVRCWHTLRADSICVAVATLRSPKCL